MGGFFELHPRTKHGTEATWWPGYFECPAKHGLFARAPNLVRLQKVPQAAIERSPESALKGGRNQPKDTVEGKVIRPPLKRTPFQRLKDSLEEINMKQQNESDQVHDFAKHFDTLQNGSSGRRVRTMADLAPWQHCCYVCNYSTGPRWTFPHSGLSFYGFTLSDCLSALNHVEPHGKQLGL